jgi:hypothetical protein
MIKKNNTSVYIIDKNILKKFSQRLTIFGRKLYDIDADFYRKGMYDNSLEIIEKNNRGYSEFDYAKMMGSWTVYDYFHDAFNWKKLTDAKSIMNKPLLKKLQVNNPQLLSKEIKRAAIDFGAFTVGVTKINPLWIYSKNRENKDINIPKNCKYAIVMTVKMEGSMIKKSPSFVSGVATGLAYSKMAFIISCMAEFIRNLGYDAIPTGNDTALSIPLAIDAGLGQLGRNGLLITPEYGPCVRICKIFTDLPLHVDKPINFGVTEFCKNCNKCVEVCDAEAIQKVKEPSFKIQCPSNNKGILRWAVNHDKCYNFWIKNGGECSNCIAACPFFNKK